MRNLLILMALLVAAISPTQAEEGANGWWYSINHGTSGQVKYGSLEQITTVIVDYYNAEVRTLPREAQALAPTYPATLQQGAQGIVRWKMITSDPGIKYDQQHIVNYQVCPTGQLYYQSTKQCQAEPPINCESKTGQVASAGTFLIGNNPTDPFPNTACHATCSVRFTGDVPGAQQLVSGKYKYFAVGRYEYSGFDCAPGESGPPSPTPLPPPTCGTGQVMGQVNGKTVCINNGNGQIDNPHTPEKTEEKTKTPPVQNPDGSTTETETTTKADGSTTIVTTTTNPDGSTTQTTTTQPGAGSTSSGSQQGSANQNGNDSDPKVDICTENPNIPACKDADSGEAASTDGLYEANPDRKTFGTILEGFADKVTQLGWYQSVSGFFNVQVPSGSCGGMSGTAGFGGYSFDYDLDPIFCGSAAQTMYSILSIGVQLAATWIAFSIAFL